MSERHLISPQPKLRVHHYMNADGFCHAGDMFEQGTEFVALYTAEELVRIVNAEKAEAWEQGHRDLCIDCCCRPDRNPYAAHKTTEARA